MDATWQGLCRDFWWFVVVHSGLTLKLKSVDSSGSSFHVLNLFGHLSFTCFHSSGSQLQTLQNPPSASSRLLYMGPFFCSYQPMTCFKTKCDMQHWTLCCFFFVAQHWAGTSISLNHLITVCSTTSFSSDPSLWEDGCGMLSSAGSWAMA